MSLSKVAVSCLASVVAFGSLASLVTTVAHADESTTRASLSVEAPAPPVVVVPTAAPRLQATAAVDFGLVQIDLQAGLRYDWFEADVGLRGYLDSNETYVGLKLLHGSERAAVPYLYGQIGNWKDAGGFFGKGDGDQSSSGALAAGGVGLEVHMGGVASFLLHVGVDHQYGTTQDATKLEAGIGFGVRL